MVNRLSDEQLDELSDIFAVFNQSGKGITKTELQGIFRKYAKQVSPEKLDEIMRVADVAGSGYIDFYEFCLLFSKQQEREEAEKELHDAFAVFDRDGNGSISFKELRFIMQAVTKPTMSDDEVKSILSAFDTASDGEISYMEFQLIVQKMLAAQKAPGQSNRPPVSSVFD